MQIFFSSLPALETFTRSLTSLPQQAACPFCSQSSQWVSHGYVYKQTSATESEIVGKRILCSNRNCKQGCGHTRQLYLASLVPGYRYRLKSLLLFISFLLKRATITHAYHQAIGHDHFEPRQAYRWLAALYRQLGWFRGLLGKNARDASDQSFRSNRLTQLLPTLQWLFASLTTPDAIQQHYQQALIEPR